MPEHILLRAAEEWCSGRSDLPDYEVGYLYEEILDIISTKMENEPDLKVIGISSIENKLLNEKYEKRWIEKGYVTVDSNGRR